jgi:beta-glucosidase
MRLEGFFTPKATGTHTLALSAVGFCKLHLDNQVVLDHTSESQMGKQITADLKLEGGKSYAIKLEYYYQGDGVFRSVHIGHQPPHADDLIAEAVSIAKKADVVILVAGLNDEWESEGFDRVDMKLPGDQDKLIGKIARANRNTIIVLNAGSPVGMPWIDRVPAVLQLWYDSQEQGNALADVLFGDVSPSGKLPVTFPVRLEDNPAYINYPGEKGKVRYGEGIFVGYRYYDKKDVAPLFPFGHGLSYAKFNYSNLRLSKKSISPNDTLKVRVDVINTGKVTGREIVQMYVHDVKSTFARPEKELKAFEKIELKPEQRKTVSFTLDREAFWYFDAVKNDWSTEAGEFEILIGASSRDIRLKGKVELGSGKAGSLHSGLPLRVLLADEKGRAIIARYFGDWLDSPMIEMGMEMTLDQISGAVPDMLTPELLAQIEKELVKVS